MTKIRYLGAEGRQKSWIIRQTLVMKILNYQLQGGYMIIDNMDIFIFAELQCRVQHTLLNIRTSFSTV